MGTTRFKRRLTGLLLLTVLCAMLPQGAAGRVVYDTFTRDGYGRVVVTQPAYYPVGFVAHELRDGEAPSPMNQPEDLFVDGNDELYIADTLNNRIVHLDADGRLIRFLRSEDSPLRGPTGVAVTEDGDIYVADNGNKRIVRLDRSGAFAAEYGRPDSPLVPANLIYEPFKLAVDDRGYMYVLSKGSYQGILLLDQDGGFQGFFGTNATRYTVFDAVKRSLYTKEQLARQIRLLPDVIGAIDIDREGYVYTATPGAGGEQVKKLNVAGYNLFRNRGFDYPGNGSPKFADVDISADGIVTLLEPEANAVVQFDPEGNLLFYWLSYPSAGRSTLGAISLPSAVDSNSRGELFVLDKNQHVAQRFKPTHFGGLVHRASALTLNGNYEESVPLWEEAAKLNANYSLSQRGLAQAAFQRQDYGQALGFFREAGVRAGYSDTFWQLRLEWFQRHFAMLANTILALSALLLVFRRQVASAAVRFGARAGAAIGRYRLADQLRHAFTVLRHPIDGFSDLRFRGKGGYRSASALLVLVAAALLLNRRYTGFAFSAGDPDSFRAATVLVQFAVLFLSWVLCNYLISSITQGEGRFKDVYVGSAYALTPIVLLGLPLTGLSNVLTLSEKSIYSFLDAVVLIWCGLLLYWMVQSLHNYSVFEALGNVALSVVSAAILWLLAFIVYGLASEFVGFVRSVMLEVMSR